MNLEEGMSFYGDRFTRPPKKKKTYKSPEKTFKKFLSKLLFSRGHLVHSVNQRPVYYDENGDKIYTGYVAGTFDLIICNCNNFEYYEIDTKSETGVPTPSQLGRMKKYPHLKGRFHFINKKNYKAKMEELNL